MSQDQNDQTIIRTPRTRDHPYSVIARKPFNDKRLSWAARGLLAYLLTKPDNWEIRLGDLINQFDPELDDGEERPRGGGRDAVYAMLRELRRYGYYEREPIRDDRTQRVIGWVGQIHEEPVPVEPEVAQKLKPKRDPLPVEPYTAEPDMVEPFPAKPHIYRIGTPQSSDSYSVVNHADAHFSQNGNNTAHTYASDGSLYEEPRAVRTAPHAPEAPPDLHDCGPSLDSPPVVGDWLSPDDPPQDVPASQDQKIAYVNLVTYEPSAGEWEYLAELEPYAPTEPVQGERLGEEPRQGRSGDAEAGDFLRTQPIEKVVKLKRAKKEKQPPTEDGMTLRAIAGWWTRKEAGYPNQLWRKSVDGGMAKRIVEVGRQEGWDTDTLLRYCQACYTYLFGQEWRRGNIHLGTIGMQLPLWYHQIQEPSQRAEIPADDAPRARVSAFKQKVQL
jgi:hypothetical protein